MQIVLRQDEQLLLSTRATFLQVIQKILRKFGKPKIEPQQKAKIKTHLSRQVNQVAPVDLSFRITVSSTDSTLHRHHCLSSKPRKKWPNQQTLVTVVDKKDTGTVDALKRTKTEIDAEEKNYV